MRALPPMSFACSMNETRWPAGLRLRSPGPKAMHFFADVFA